MMHTDIDRIWAHLAEIAREPRFAETARLEECRQYCERQLQESGWVTQRQPFSAADSTLREFQGINIVAQPGGNADAAGSTLRPRFVVGAHLDTREDTPGADDNGSAVAVLLEMARVIGDARQATLPVDIELVVFDLEELGMLGGAYHARRCREQNVNLVGMVSLEMLGYCDPSPGSQSLPPELAGQYSDVGNFIAVVGNQDSGSLMQSFVAGLRTVADLPVESLQVPDNGLPLPPTRLSDHSPFWDAGYAALMITDTSFMRNPHYHLPSDTIDTLDRNFLHRVADGVLAAVKYVLSTGTP